MTVVSTMPVLRFGKFSGAWEEKKLGKMGTPYNGLSGKTKDDFGHGNGRYVTYMNVFSNPVAKISQCEAIEIDSSQNEVRNGDVFFTTSSETPEEVGMSSVWIGEAENIYLNSFCFGYRPKPWNISEFLAYLFRSNRFRNEITYLAQGISRYNISKGRVMELVVRLPEQDEQRKIGLFFQVLDVLIVGREKALGKLEELKKAMLLKMFPEDGAKVPEVRFKGFDGEWEEKTLGKMGSPYNGLSGKTKDDFGHGDGRYVTYMNVFSNPIAKIGQCEAVEIDPVQHVVKDGDVFFTTSSETPEEVGMSSVWIGEAQNIYLNSFCFGYRPKPGNSSEFLAYRFRSIAFRNAITFLAQGISRYNISKAKVMEIPVLFPKIEEQRKIGTFFCALDTAIAGRRKEVEKLKQLKKGLLERMFA